MSNWIRVNRNDRCPVCGHDSWCTYSDKVVLCMRVESDFTKIFRNGETGWIHPLRDEKRKPFVPYRKLEEPPMIDAARLWSQYASETGQKHIDILADSLGVSGRSLQQLGCVYAKPHHAYAFPMSDGSGRIVGLRLRSLDGRKWAVKGSKQGIFTPKREGANRGFICEGPTDTAAALTLDLYAVGRPHCSGGTGEIVAAFKRNKVREAIILSDNDEPGLRGAKQLQEQLAIPSCVLVLPCKDMREAVTKGVTSADIGDLVSNLVWHRPT